MLAQFLINNKPMHPIVHRIPSGRFGLYAALSLLIHAILISLWEMPPSRGPITHAPTPVVFDLTQPVVQKQLETHPKETQPSTKATPQPTVSADQTKAPKPSASKEPHPRSILFDHAQKSGDVLGLSQALPAFGTSKGTASGFDLAKKNLNDLVRQYQQPPQTAKPKSKWKPTLSQAAREGTAVYAAYAAHNVPAMLAVTGLSLTRGTLGKGVGSTIRAIKNAGQKPSEMTGKDNLLLAHVVRQTPTTARDLYMTMPKGWTYASLKEALDKLVRRGKLVREGKGHKATYRAN